MTATTSIPFEIECLHDPEATDETREFYNQVAHQFRAAATVGGLMTLGARDLAVIPGRYQRGGLLFTASILPFRKDGTRGTAPRNMAVMISTTPLDEIEIEVRQFANEKVHARLDGVYIDELRRALLALDYDGKAVLNPRYWS